jgi:hypothetical protein
MAPGLTAMQASGFCEGHAWSLAQGTGKLGSPSNHSFSPCEQGLQLSRGCALTLLAANTDLEDLLDEGGRQLRRGWAGAVRR